MQKINVLGQEYEVEILEKPDELMLELKADGYTDCDNKIIAVMDNQYKNRVLRHEIVHAFLFESGMDCGTLFHTEENVDWIAFQMPKMIKVMEEMGCLNCK